MTDEMRPEPGAIRPEPGETRPEPVDMRPEPVEGPGDGGRDPSEAYERLAPDDLRELFLFESLDSAQLDWLAGRGYVQRWSAGGTVYAEGGAGTCFFVVVEGTL